MWAPHEPIFSVTRDGKLARPGRGGLLMALFRLGRIGGLVALAAGLGLLWATSRAIASGQGYFLLMPALGVALTLLGGVLLVFGNGEQRALRPISAGAVSPALRAQLEATSRPFVLCTACRATTPEMYCHRCSSQQHTMMVTTDVDLALALTVLET